MELVLSLTTIRDSTILELAKSEIVKFPDTLSVATLDELIIVNVPKLAIAVTILTIIEWRSKYKIYTSSSKLP
jgi:hypothetical protein